MVNSVLSFIGGFEIGGEDDMTFVSFLMFGVCGGIRMIPAENEQPKP